MKKILLLSGILLLSLFLTVKTAYNLTAGPAARPKVNWMDFDKAAAHMKANPKKVYIDMYTNWCHWCKVMDNKTLSNPNVINYLNENFYAIKFDAESKEDVAFNGKIYKYDAKRKAHELAIELMNGRLSFPTSIFMEEGFTKPQPVPGFLKTTDMEMILKYMGEDKNKTTPWAKWQESFKPTWK